MPGAKFNLTTLTLVGGAPAYPGSVAPTGTGGESAPELTAVNSHQFLMIERDGAGDAVTRSRSRTNERTGPLPPDDNEFILIQLSERLKVDQRILTP